ncbi:hypothetical protein ISCGN_017468 [Ixodes scapularis]
MPCSYLWLAGPIEFYRLSCSEAPKLPWTLISGCKLALSAVMVALHLYLLMHENFFREEHMGTLVKLLTLLLATMLHSLTRLAGMSSSAIQFGFWLLFTASAAVSSVSVFRENAFPQNSSEFGNDDAPPLSPCLRGTLLSWMPCSYLWLAGPIEFYRLSCSEAPKLPWTLISGCKLALSAVMVALHLYLLMHENFFREEHMGTLVKLLTLLLATMLHSLTRLAGMSSSAIQFGFWLLFTASAAVSSVSVFRENAANLTWAANDESHAARRAWTEAGSSLQTTGAFLSAVMLVLSCLADRKRRHIQEKCSPVVHSPFLSRLTFHWMNPLILKGFKSALKAGDIPPSLEEMNPAVCYKEMTRHWRVGGGDAVQAAGLSSSSLFWALLKCYPGPLLLIGFLETIFCLSVILPIYLLEVMIQFVGGNEPYWKGYSYALLLAASSIAANLLYSQIYYFSVRLALSVKTTLIACLYRKVLTAWSTGGDQMTAGEVINSITLDTDKVAQTFVVVGDMWGAPLRLLFTMAMLWQYLGPSSLVAILVVVIVLIASFALARRVQAVQTDQMATKDLRIKHVNELLSGIKILKLNAWERPFEERVVNSRKKEVQMLHNIVHLYSVMNFVWNCISFLVSLVTFMTYLIVSSKTLDPVTAFVSLALFNTLRFSLLLIPDLVVQAVVCAVATGRMRKFLQSEDLDRSQVGRQPDTGDAVTIRQATFSWHRDKRFVLKDLDLHVPQGKLVAIVGHVGSGKTSLLSAILGELRCVQGSIDRKGKLAYVAQQAWIQNATLQQNILLKRGLRPCFYQRVVRACQLQADLEALPAGDQTEIGGRGANLSGGQKQRISLARAVYQNADLYVMDDPLSAVDAQVGAALFHGVIGRRGLLRNKVRRRVDWFDFL